MIWLNLHEYTAFNIVVYKFCITALRHFIITLQHQILTIIIILFVADDLILLAAHARTHNHNSNIQRISYTSYCVAYKKNTSIFIHKTQPFFHMESLHIKLIYYLWSGFLIIVYLNRMKKKRIRVYRIRS